MDDILVGSQTFDGMHEKLERILKVLKECGLTVILDKCELNEQAYAIISAPLRILLRKDQPFS